MLMDVSCSVDHVHCHGEYWSQQKSAIEDGTELDGYGECHLTFLLLMEIL